MAICFGAFCQNLYDGWNSRIGQYQNGRIYDRSNSYQGYISGNRFYNRSGSLIGRYDSSVPTGVVALIYFYGYYPLQ